MHLVGFTTETGFATSWCLVSVCFDVLVQWSDDDLHSTSKLVTR